MPAEPSADAPQGFHDFAWGNRGWSFLAVRAPHARVEKCLRQRSDVLAYESSPSIGALKTDHSILPRSDRRTTFLLQLAGSNWTLIIRTVHWLRSVDSWAVASLALELSGQIKCPTISAAQDDGGSPDLQLFEGGQLAVRANPVRGKEREYTNRRSQFDSYFTQNALFIPAAFIDSAGTLFLCDADRAQVDAVDRITFGIAPGDRVEERHVVYRLENLELHLSSNSFLSIDD